MWREAVSVQSFQCTMEGIQQPKTYLNVYLARFQLSPHAIQPQLLNQVYLVSSIYIHAICMASAMHVVFCAIQDGTLIAMISMMCLYTCCPFCGLYTIIPFYNIICTTVYIYIIYIVLWFASVFAGFTDLGDRCGLTGFSIGRCDLYQDRHKMRQVFGVLKL